MHVTVIGSGLVGLATAYRLLHTNRPPRVTVVDKEDRVGAHQSSHNSGVLHCGLHYRPGSLKAKLAVAGIRQMIEFCRERDIAFEQCGKLVVAVDPAELERMAELERRGHANGLAGLRRLDGDEIREREPHVRGVAGLLVPEEGIVDFPGVCIALAREIERRGGELRLGHEVRALGRDTRGWHIETNARSLACDFVVSCAGLHADRIAALAGLRPSMTIVPFRGEYYRLREERQFLVRHMIYPVPDPRFPFLGVHLHRRIGGGIEGGPTAVLAAAREGYRFRDVAPGDLLDSLRARGLWKFAARYPRMCWTELQRSASRAAFARALQRLVPEIEVGDLERSGSGVRAQGLTPEGTLVEDFLFAEDHRALHVLNAPSPAATASLAIGEHIAGLIRARLA